MRLFDLHCDTPVKTYQEKVDVFKNELHVSLESAACFSPFFALGAVFTPRSIPDGDGMDFARSVISYWRESGAPTIAWREELARYDRGFLLTVEDARILNGSLSSLDELWALGVRVLTPLWRDVGALGGAWNTSDGLSHFGKAAVARALELGMILDVSHASVSSFWEIYAACQAAKKPSFASHSNAFALTKHGRNLDDEQLRAIADCGGVCGVTLYPPFVRGDNANLEDIARHIRHIVSVGGEEFVAIGSDFDGVDALPRGISNISDLPNLAEHLQKCGCSARLIDRLFFENAYRFIVENLLSK